MKVIGIRKKKLADCLTSWIIDFYFISKSFKNAKIVKRFKIILTYLTEIIISCRKGRISIYLKTLSQRSITSIQCSLSYMGCLLIRNYTLLSLEECSSPLSPCGTGEYITYWALPTRGVWEVISSDSFLIEPEKHVFVLGPPDPEGDIIPLNILRLWSILAYNELFWLFIIGV